MKFRHPAIGAMTAAIFVAFGAPLTAQTQAGTQPVSDAAGHELPLGRGQLSQDVITVQLRSGDLSIRFVPLDERVLRLLAPDAYRSLVALTTSRRPLIDSISRSKGVHDVGLALVSFYGLAPNTRFDPQVLTVTQRGQIFRPLGVVPMTPSFSGQQLDVRQQAQAIFIYELALPVNETFTLTYLDATSDEWDRRRSRLDGERARILGRTRADSTGGR